MNEIIGPAPTPEVAQVRAAVEIAYGRACKRHVLPDTRLHQTRAAIMGRITSMPVPQAVALLQDGVRFFDRYAGMSDNEIANISYTGGGFDLGAGPAAQPWRMPPAAPAGDEIENYMARMWRRGIMFTLERDGSITPSPSHLLTAADRAEIAQRSSAIARVLRAQRAA